MKNGCSSSYLYLEFAPASNCWAIVDLLADLVAVIYFDLGILISLIFSVAQVM